MINLKKTKNRLRQSLLQVKASWRDTLCGGIAAGLAWFVSQDVLGHSNPLFASMAALVCLSPGLVNHGKQAFYLIIGVATGVVVGELFLLFPPIPLAISIGIGCFIASIIASSYAIVPVLIIQSGIATLILFAMGTQAAGFARIIDVALGSGIGLLFSQVLFTPDPLKSLTLSAELFFHELASIFDTAAEALEKNDHAAALDALQKCNVVHSSLISLSSSVSSAKESAVWSLRGLISSREVTTLSAQYNRASIRLYASTLLLCEAILTRIKKNQNETVPAWFLESLRINSKNCRFLAGELKSGTFTRQDRSSRGEIPIAWVETANGLQLIENTIARFYKSKTRRSRLIAFRKRHMIAVAREKALKRNTVTHR